MEMEDSNLVLMNEDLDDETSKFLAIGKRYFNKRAKSYVDGKYDTSSSNYKLKVVLSDEWNALKIAEKLSYAMMAHKDKIEKSNAKKTLKQMVIEKEKSITQLNFKIIDKAIGGMKNEKRHIVPITVTPLSVDVYPNEMEMLDLFDNSLESHFFFDFPIECKEEEPRFTRIIKSVSISIDSPTTIIQFKTVRDCKEVGYGDIGLQPIHSQVERMEIPLSLLKRNANKQSTHFAQSLKNEKRFNGTQFVLFSSYAFWVQREKDIVLRSISWEPQANVAKDKILKRIKNKNKTHQNMQLIELLTCFGVKKIEGFVYAESNEKCKIFAHKDFQALLNMNPMELLGRFFDQIPQTEQGDDMPFYEQTDREHEIFVVKEENQHCEHLVFDEGLVFDEVNGCLSEQVTVEFLPDGTEPLEMDQIVAPYY